MDIKTEPTTLERIFNGYQTKYSVPDYQRDYSWKSDQVEELWSDIITSRKNNTEYFMGTIVLNADSTQDQYEIVDGQQRLSTFTLLFSVIASIGNCFELNKDIFPGVERNEESRKKARRIHDMARERLFYLSEPDNYYLTINKKDRNIFDQQVRSLDLVLTEENELKAKSNESRIIKTKKLFYKLILDEFVNKPDPLNELNQTLIHFVKRLKFITIIVNSDYDAFLLFESLNSKGMDLSIADLVKNKLLMYENSSEDKSYKLLTNWDDMISSMEGKSRISSVDYLRIYWMSFIGNNITKKELYKHVKSYLSESNNALDFSIDLKIKAERFSEFTDRNLVWPSGQHNNNKVLQIMSEINTLKYTLCYPVLLYSSFNAQEVLEELAQLSLSYLFRWVTIGDYSVGTANETFNKVLSLLKEGEKDKYKLFEPFNNDISRIGDDEFKNSFKTFRTKDNAVAKYILGKIYAHSNNYECVANFNKVQLEHILPQKPWKWLNEGGFEIPEGTIIEDWIYHIGNMTLLNKTLNQGISNSLFNKKAYEYKDSPFPMTNEIFKEFNCDNKDWKANRIIERAEVLSDLAVNIWPLNII